jgi:RNA recognition motif-containing protein
MLGKSHVPDTIATTAESPGVHESRRGATAEGVSLSSKLFVGNLEFSTSQDDLMELFSQAGTVTEVFLPTDRATGRPRGFAFVEFADPEAAEAAIERFDGYELGGRPLRVNSAEERRPFAGGQGGGHGGGGGGGRPTKSRPKGSRRNARAKKRSL